MDYSLDSNGLLAYSPEAFSAAKRFVFRKWCERAVERGRPRPTDLSGACKFGSLFMHRIFGGTIRGNYAHQYNYIAGRVVDLSHDALDVGAMYSPYLHEPDYFKLATLQASLAGCIPRIDRWEREFLAEYGAADANSDCTGELAVQHT